MIADAPEAASKQEAAAKEDDRETSGLERVLPELVRRVVEAGLEKLIEGPQNVRNLIGELKTSREEVARRRSATGSERPAGGSEPAREPGAERRPSRDVIGSLLTQVDETKHGVYRAVATEVREFLEHTNLADEIARVLTSLSFEVKTEVRFIPNERRPAAPRPDVSSSVEIHRHTNPAKPETAASVARERDA